MPDTDTTLQACWPESGHGLLRDDPQPGVLLDADGIPCGANIALRRMLGESMQIDAWLPPNYRHLVRACLTQGRAVAEVEVQAPDQRLLLWTFIPAEAGSHVLARARDATVALRNHHEASVARRLYRLIIENTTDLISRHTPGGHFLDASPASWTLLGFWPEQLRGTEVQSLFHPQDREQLLERYRAALEQDGYLTVTYRIRHRDGHYLWFETASRAIRETYTGSVVEVVSVSRDITARIQTEESNRKLQDELAHAARLATLGELASGIAHEINQPLAAIVNYAGASQRYLSAGESGPEMPGKVAHGLERITEHANHASRVIRRLRGFLRKGQRRLQLVNPGDLARDAVRLCAWEANQHQVQIVEQLAPDLPDVQGDPILLGQVLLNLLRNAIEANRETHEDEPSSITLELSASAQQIDIRVLDQGPGATTEQLARMFTPFYTSKPEGLGLGLSMSLSIVEGFGGGLQASSLESGGLCLHCWLPVNNQNNDRK